LNSAFTLVSPTEELLAQYSATPIVKVGKARTYPIYKSVDDLIAIPKDRSERPPPLAVLPTTIRLRDYQEEPVNEVANILATKHTGVFLKAACGVGKTVIALAVAEKLGVSSVVVIVDQKNIATQWAERISQFLPDKTVAVFSSTDTPLAEIRQSNAAIKIILAQSLMRQEWFYSPLKCQLLICDEAHVFSAPRFCGAMYNIDYERSLALTATEIRKDGLTWVFYKFLAGTTVEVKGRTMTARVVRPRITVDFPWYDYRTAWCIVYKSATWKARCSKCPLFDKFPVKCGGRLPLGPKGVQWNPERLMWTSMLSDLVNDEKYLNTFIPVIRRFFEAGRQVLIFNQFRAPLNYLHTAVGQSLGAANVGLYISGVKDGAAELAKPLTFTTFKMSEKALDVPWKDSIIMTSPVSQIEQTAGRSTRIQLGKKQPVIFDPQINNIGILRRQSEKRTKQCRELGFIL